MTTQGLVATVFASDLDHPEGLAVASDGSIWAGGEAGQIYIVASDGQVTEHARTGGFSGGLAFDQFGPDPDHPDPVRLRHWLRTRQQAPVLAMGRLR